MIGDPAEPAELARLGVLIDGWLAQQVATNPAVAGSELIEPGRRWYLRLTGDQKATFGVVLTLGQRTLAYETYLMPGAPAATAPAVHEHLLRRNATLRGCHLAIGEEEAVYLMGRIGAATLDEGSLDQVLGILFEATERCFRPAMRLAFPDFDPPRN